MNGDRPLPAFALLTPAPYVGAGQLQWRWTLDLVSIRSLLQLAGLWLDATSRAIERSADGKTQSPIRGSYKRTLRGQFMSVSRQR